MDVLIEGFGPDAIALARLLAGEGNAVRIASPEPEPRAAGELRELGIDVQPSVDLDADPGDAEIAYLDVWTPEVAPRVETLRARGTRVSCLGDLLLERWKGPSIGITGTAGKTTTTALVASILRQAGIDVAVSRGARAGNLWPTADLLERIGVETDGAGTTLLLELTSSHLAFMHSSPTLAAVISFWPDHLELHGTLERYRAAKEQIVRYQHAGDRVVVNADDASAAFADATPAGVWEISLARRGRAGRVPRPGARRRRRRRDDRDGARRTSRTRRPPRQRRRGGRDRDRSRRRRRRSRRGSTRPTYRRGARSRRARSAAFPWSTTAWPRRRPRPPRRSPAIPAGSVVLIAGGLNDAGGGSVHATPAEHALLEQACDVIARVARVVVLFGEAGPRLAPLLAGVRSR